MTVYLKIIFETSITEKMKITNIIQIQKRQIYYIFHDAYGILHDNN